MQAMNWALAAVLCLVALLVGAAIAGFLAYRKGVQSGVEQRKQQADALKSADRNTGFSRKRKIWTKRQIIWTGRKNPSSSV